jgi:hypothetical protein
MHLWTAPPGAAPHEDIPWTELAPGPALPSALDTIVPDPAAPEAVAEDAVLRTRWYVRPRLAVTVLDDGWHPDLGIAAGHQWWKFTDVAVAPAGETRLVATLPIGAPGYDLALSSAAGLWLARRVDCSLAARGRGPNGVEQQHTDRAIAVGRRAVAFELGLVRPWFEIDGGWIVDGDRPPSPTALGCVLRARRNHLRQSMLLKLDGAHDSTGSGGSGK